MAQRESRNEVFQLNVNSTRHKGAVNKWLEQHSIDNQIETFSNQAAALRKSAAKGGSSAQNYTSRANRLETAVSQLKTTRNTGAITVNKAANQLADFVEMGAKDVDEGGTRVPGQQPPGTLGGASFYVDYAVKGDNRDEAMHTAQVQSKLSGGYPPPVEVAGYHALAQAHQGGSLQLTPRLAKKIGHTGGMDRVNFRDLTGDHVAKLAGLSGADRSHLDANSSGINWNDLTPVKKNLKPAHDLMRSGGVLDARTNPKYVAYALGKVLSGEASHGQIEELYDRGRYIADRVNKRIPLGQGMLDLHGHRDDNSGILSPNLPTAQDTWMAAGVLGRGIPARKAVGDAPTVGKAGIAAGDGSVSAEAVQHAALDLITQRGGQVLEERHATPFKVPSLLVQPPAWDAIRGSTPKNTRAKTATANPALNDYQKAQVEAVKATARAQKLSRAADPNQGKLF